MVGFATGLIPLFKLTAKYLGTRVAWWSLAFFLTQPLVFSYGGMAAVDGALPSVFLWFWYFADRLIAKPTVKDWIGSTVFGLLLITLKLPYFFAFGLAAFLLLLKDHRSSVKRWIALGSVGAVSGILFLGWTQVANHLQADAVFPLVDLRLSNPEIVFWYFGDWAYRLNPANWIKGGWRMLNNLFGSFALVALLLYAWRRDNGNTFAKFALIGGLASTLVFSHLVLHHIHYYIMFAPPVAILMAQGLVAIESRLRPDGGFTAIPTVFIGGLLMLSLIQGLIGMKITLRFDSYPQRMAEIIKEHTTPSDKLAIQGGGWGGGLLMQSQRDGLSIWNTKIFENAENYQKLKSLGFNKLVLVSESPLLTAVQQVNPGEGDRKRSLYTSGVRPVIEAWPTIYESEDILIKEIP